MLAISRGTLAAIAVIVVLDMFAVVFGVNALRGGRARSTDREDAERTSPVTRREFFRRSLATSLGVFGAQFGTATIAFLWPDVVGSFGTVMTAGRASEIRARIADSRQPFYSGQGRFYVVGYDGKRTEDVDYERDGLAADGLMALYQRCVHLGCRVPFCESSQWFECPCHQSKYNAAGEYMSGPAPRGMDRFRIRVEGDQLVVDTSQVVLGPPRGTDTIKQPIAGPFCVASV